MNRGGSLLYRDTRTVCLWSTSVDYISRLHVYETATTAVGHTKIKFTKKKLSQVDSYMYMTCFQSRHILYLLQQLRCAYDQYVNDMFCPIKKKILRKKGMIQLTLYEQNIFTGDHVIQASLIHKKNLIAWIYSPLILTTNSSKVTIGITYQVV